MTSFASLPLKDRRDFLQEGAALRNISPVVLEKDFWVCWLLDIVFQDPSLAPNLVFKGGTSLSKVFNAIQRFSEDIDLSVAPESLGMAEEDLDEAPSASQREKRAKKLEAACIEHVKTVARPILEEAVRQKLGDSKKGQSWFSFELDPFSNSPVLLFAYPSALPPEVGYIIPVVKLEFGSLTDQRPHGRHMIKPWLADVFPNEISDGQAEVVALEIERTFWEKATILHAEYHRPQDKAIRDRSARHYSDVAALWLHPSCSEAKRRFDLLERVVRHKSLFFGTAWASYETATPASIRLVPPKSRQAELRQDYRKMESMFLESPPSFNRVLDILRQIEKEIRPGKRDSAE